MLTDLQVASVSPVLREGTISSTTAANPFGTDFWSGNRGIAWLALLELVVLVVVLLRVLARRAGPRGLFRGLWQQVVVTGRAFAAPFVAWRRDRRGVATLTRYLGTPETFDLTTRAVARARSAGVEPWAVVLADERVSVRLTAANSPEVTGPWAADPEDPLLWSTSVAELGATAPDSAAPGSGVPDSAAPDAEAALPVVVGLLDSGVVLLDLSAVAPVVAVTGDSAAGRDLGHALTAQLARRLPAGSVGVARGVHPGFAGRTPGELCADPGVRVMVCAEPELEPELEDELAAFTRSRTRRMLVLGDVRGRRLTLRPDAFGVLPAADGLGPVETAGLARAVARVVRSGHLTPSEPLPPSPTPPNPAAALPGATLSGAGGGGADGSAAPARNARTSIPGAGARPEAATACVGNEHGSPGSARAAGASAAGSPNARGSAVAEVVGTITAAATAPATSTATTRASAPGGASARATPERAAGADGAARTGSTAGAGDSPVGVTNRGNSAANASAADLSAGGPANARGSAAGGPPVSRGPGVPGGSVSAGAATASGPRSARAGRSGGSSGTVTGSDAAPAAASGPIPASGSGPASASASASASTASAASRAGVPSPPRSGAATSPTTPAPESTRQAAVPAPAPTGPTAPTITAPTPSGSASPGSASPGSAPSAPPTPPRRSPAFASARHTQTPTENIPAPRTNPPRSAAPATPAAPTTPTTQSIPPDPADPPHPAVPAHPDPEHVPGRGERL
ncbi:hypothetical protein ACIRL2_34655 [Embleya sp. NPDC127516]|uniref:hypothetical protein n=1 Tax=Embleya sp. NPDC127516 TaxID=3363990 RepID=UPI00382081E5